MQFDVTAHLYSFNSRKTHELKKIMLNKLIQSIFQNPNTQYIKTMTIDSNILYYYYILYSNIEYSKTLYIDQHILRNKKLFQTIIEKLALQILIKSRCKI